MGLLLVDNQYLQVATALIDQAKEMISISTFKLEMTDQPRGDKLKIIFEALANEIKQGVKVRVLMNWHANRHGVPRSNYPAGVFLKNCGADVRYLKNNRCCHAKILLIDKKKILLGSHNLSIRSCEANFEMSYLIPDPETVAEAAEIFERLFAGAEKL
jgi:phosphatidylserine/phosphatidylglycerophosphate/cardiolipin synthase-like enzyme